MNKKYFIAFSLVSLTLVSLIFVTCYGVGQQILRQAANEPQAQVAEATVNVLKAGRQAAEFDVKQRSDISQIATPFLIIYGSDGKVLASTAQLNGSVPVIPMGVLNYAKSHGVDKVTWQPQKGVRIAAVVMPFDNGKESGSILVGRSLKETEKLECDLLKAVSVAWGIAILLVAAGLSLFKNSDKA